ncbi:MAG: hypothetical protein PHW75_03410 [Patescibacteria group bacterium]|nr:hypothetical protein [Patescibacteria group bacterium]
MDMNSRNQYLKTLQKEYLKASKSGKTNLLNEAVKRTGLDRDHVIKKLSPRTNWNKKKRAPTTRSRQYGSDLIIHLVKLWDIFDNPCEQRLKPLIEKELPRLRSFREIAVTDDQATKLIKMCPSTIDSFLSREKGARILKEKYQKKRNPLLYQQIPTKMSDQWDRDIVGQIQIDGVEHCGQSASGQYANTISHTDISSHWWEGEAVMGKAQGRTLDAIKAVRARFPFDWKEIHPDNGTSFINYFIYDYSKVEELEFSRSRPYEKNDNCFVEQKNSQNVRKVVGHLRYDTEEELAILNDLYRNELRLYKNFFQPVLRLETKTRSKGHIYRKHQEAKTPYQWLIDSPDVPIEVKEELTAVYNILNPAQLKRSIDLKLANLLRVYEAKHQIAIEKVEEREPKRKEATVSFSNYPTTPVRCHQLIT